MTNTTTLEAPCTDGAQRLSELKELRRRVTGKPDVKVIGDSVKLSVSFPGTLHRKATRGGRSFSRELQRLVRADLASGDRND